MGRSLTNTMINLGIQGACDEAMYQVGPGAEQKIIMTDGSGEYLMMGDAVLRTSSTVTFDVTQILAIDVDVFDASVSYRSRGQQKFKSATEPFV